jgi:short chain dehydrogenase
MKLSQRLERPSSARRSHAPHRMGDRLRRGTSTLAGLNSFDGPMMNCELNAVITGASSGIGKAIALAIASTGGGVCLVGRDIARLRAVADIAGATARATAVYWADLSMDRKRCCAPTLSRAT